MTDSELEPIEFLGPVPRCGPGGDSQPQMLRFSDGLVYAVKFPDNPSKTFGSRPLAAELMGSRIACSIGVRTPEFRVVNVTDELLARNPLLRFDSCPPRQPRHGRCLGSRWIGCARRVTHEEVPMGKHSNDLMLARLFAAANLLCLNPGDHDQPYGNLLLDADDSLWALDWGHPFWFDDGPLSNWTCLDQQRYIAYGKPAAKGFLSLPRVAAAVPSVLSEVATAHASITGAATMGVPPEWRVSDEELRSAECFLSARARALPHIARDWLPRTQ